MGIGAYQTREYVQMLGGHVEVQSSPGRGTRFSITLPAEPQRHSPETVDHRHGSPFPKDVTEP
jgi:signal transduction histidine kinase